MDSKSRTTYTIALITKRIETERYNFKKLITSSFSQRESEITARGNTIDIDAALVKDLQVGNTTAFTKLIAKYKGTIYAFCFRYTGNRQDAEDISQDVFIKVFKNIKTFRGESRFSTWLYRLTTNTCLNYTRWQKIERIKKMVSIHTEEKEEENSMIVNKDNSTNPEQILLKKELGTIINKTVARLKDKQRAVLIFKDFQDKSYDEIAAIMNMNPGTVKSTLSRGRLNVAKQIKGYYKP